MLTVVEPYAKRGHGKNGDLLFFNTFDNNRVKTPLKSFCSKLEQMFEKYRQTQYTTISFGEYGYPFEDLELKLRPLIAYWFVIEVLKNNPHLIGIDCTNIDMADELLLHFTSLLEKNPNIAVIRVWGIQSDLGWYYFTNALKKNKCLHTLQVQVSEFTTESHSYFQELVKHSPHLKHIQLNANSNLKTEDFIKIAKICKSNHVTWLGIFKQWVTKHCFY